VRVETAALETPSRLRPAADLYERAYREYEAALDAFVQASFSPKDQLRAAVEGAIPLAEKADKTWDRALALVQAELRRLGLPVRPTP